MGYTKLANSILTSTIWMEDDHTRIVWLTLLAMADKNGETQASIPGLANVARVPVESCRAAISKFLSPDPDSRTRGHDGRRLEEIPGGWYVINHPEYRKMHSDEDRKQKAAERQQRARDRRAAEGVGVTSHKKSHQKTHAEAEAEAEALKNTLPQAAVVGNRDLCWEALAALEGWSLGNPMTDGAGGKVGKALKDIRTACQAVTPEEINRRIKNYRTRYPEAAVTSTAISNNWALCDSGTQPAKKYDDRPL